MTEQSKAECPLRTDLPEAAWFAPQMITEDAWSAQQVRALCAENDRLRSEMARMDDVRRDSPERRAERCEE